MGYLFEFDEANNVLRVTWQGPLTDTPFIEEVVKARKFLASRPGVRGIADYSGVTAENLSSEAIKRVAWAPTRGEERAVVVSVVSNDMAFGLARMFSMLTEQQRPNRPVVRTMEEAYELLKITDPKFVSISVD